MERERSVVRLPSGRGRATGQRADLVLFRLTDAVPPKPTCAISRASCPTARSGSSPRSGADRTTSSETLIPIGKRAGLVDNKTCSVDEETSAIRFVIPRDRR